MRIKENNINNSINIHLLFSSYLLLFIIISLFHEPWFDESQAWQIAKNASIVDIIFLRPHYEGHTPLWFLILSINAKSGVPYEIGLKSVGLLFYSLTAYLILYKSPFSMIVKAILPLSYFVFYQYGIIVRPYCVMMVAFCLLGITFTNRDSKPWRFSFSLLLLCLSSAYGIVIACGIATAWLLDIYGEKKQLKALIKDFAYDQRLLSLITLLVLAIFVVFLIIPRSDTFATNSYSKNSWITRLVYMLFCCIPDSVFTQLLSVFFLHDESFSMYSLSCVIFIGIISLMIVVFISGKHNLKYFMFPFIFFVIFASSVYFAQHHIGIMYFLLLWFFWITYEQKNKGYYLNVVINKFKFEPMVRDKLLVFYRFMIFLSLVIPVFWSISASVLDLKYEYSYARGISNFINEYQLTDCKIMIPWDVKFERDEKRCGTYDEMIERADAHHYGIGIDILPYYDDNIFMNVNLDLNNEPYNTHVKATKEKNRNSFETWKQNGVPDIIIGRPEIAILFQEENIYNEYLPVYKVEISTPAIWKNNYYNALFLNSDYILARKAIIEEYGIPVIDVDIDFMSSYGLGADYLRQNNFQLEY